MNKIGNMTSPKKHYSILLLECDKGEIAEMPDREFRRITVNLYKKTEKKLHEIKKSVYDMEWKLSKETDILKKNQTEILTMNSSRSLISLQLSWTIGAYVVPYNICFIKNKRREC